MSKSSGSSPSPTPAVPDMAQMMAQMAQMIAAAQIIQQSNLQAISVPPLPLFASSDTVPACESLYSSFPNVKEKHILDITRHDFRPYGLHKLDFWVQSKADASDGSLETLDKSQGSVKDYPSLDSLLIPLSTYFSILISYALMGGKPKVGCALALRSHSYIASLMEMAKEFQWSYVLEYHVQYMNIRCQEMKQGNYLGWGPIDAQLHTWVTAHPKPASSAFPSSSKWSSRGNVSKQMCHDWNDGKCSDPCPGGQIHGCCNCHTKDHTWKDLKCPGPKAHS
ncbi:hypothetical protein GYMLUDRAFT_249686 [Collybiopsis luxurians FD-317 M1]|uniref:Uncharacterized protein n=1 Tax=Collybiopsis luxurians FD-317 M1 TaxID=944289 RepID=A0A0D0AUJ6_9AGAR|nr:hypothetical protein GYMLUDRAFT_249686 [Collybiopsis luxurians FD-317 M1]